MVEALTTESNNLVCVQCWKNFEFEPNELDPGAEAVDCPHCQASVPIPEEGGFEGDVDLENAIAEELEPVTTNTDGDMVTLGEAAFVEEIEPEFEEIIEEPDEVQVEIEDIAFEEESVEEPAAKPEPEPEPVPEAVLASEAPEEEPAKPSSSVPEDLDPESVVWKLLIPGGLTYNFHGLQALMRWASGKRNLDEVAVSLDGMRWRNCGKVIAKVEAGIAVREALLTIPTLDEESESAESSQPEPTPSVSEQIAGATEDMLEAINPTIELKGVTIPPPADDNEALMREGGVASHVGDTRFGAAEIESARSGTIPAVTGQFTFQVETNYKNLGAGTKWVARITYTSLGIVIGLALGGALHHLGMWKEIFKLISP